MVTPELIKQQCEEYASKPFNISERARQLGIKKGTLSYHIRGGKASAIYAHSWRRIAASACGKFRNGDKAGAVAALREAANILEENLHEATV